MDRQQHLEPTEGGHDDREHPLRVGGEVITGERVALGAEVEDDAAWYAKGHHPETVAALVAMRDTIREATQQEWKLEHTGGGCTLLSLQGEGVEWTIVGDFFAPMSLEDEMFLFRNVGEARFTGDYEQTETLAEDMPFRDVMALVIRMASGEVVA